MALGCIDSEPRSVGATSGVDMSDDSNDASDMTESQDDSDGADLVDSDDSTDVSDASDTGDSADSTNAMDVSDAVDIGDATDAADVSDESATSDATDSEDASDLTDASDSESSTDATDGSDTSEGTDTTDGIDATDGTVAKECSASLDVCAADEFCLYAFEDSCGNSGATGVCTPISDEPCPAINAPACGCDGEKYDNKCFAHAAGVSVTEDLNCGEDNASCGGNLGPCPEGTWCSFDSDDACGTADTIGTCTPYPEICQTIFMPVCGCDNQTYSNKCVANAAGVNVASVGACDDPIIDDICGGSLGLVCGDDAFCEYADLSCGDDQAVGTCVPKPLLCPIFPDPVCGCDGKYYNNACLANSSGVSVSDDTACLDGEGPGGQPCGGFLGLSCSPAHYCAFELAANCGMTDASGTCQLKPKTCDDSIGLSICACDGNFYPSVCEAAKAGFSPAPGMNCQF